MADFGIKRVGNVLLSWSKRSKLKDYQLHLWHIHFYFHESTRHTDAVI